MHHLSRSEVDGIVLGAIRSLLFLSRLNCFDLRVQRKSMVGF